MSGDFDIRDFCLGRDDEFIERVTYRDDELNRLCAPFNFGEFTYACDLRIMVRVRRSPLAAMFSGRRPIYLGKHRVDEFVDAWVEDAEYRGFGPMPLYVLVTRKKEWGLLAKFPRQDFQYRYIEMIKDLSGLEVCFGERDHNPMVFRWRDGEGLLMSVGRGRNSPDDEEDEPVELRAAA